MTTPAVDGRVKSRSGKRVLFAMNSPHGISRGALRKVAHLAAALGAELELFYCAFDPDITHPGRVSSRTPEEDIQEYVEHRQKQLWSLAKDLRATGLSVHSRVEWDSLADEGIVCEVLRQQPTFLVVEAYQASPKLIETCPCPLLLIRSTHSYPTHPRIAAAVDPMHTHAKPAALDDAIVRASCEVSTALSGELHLFHARVPWATASHEARGPRWVPDVAKDAQQVTYEHEVRSRVAELAQCHNISTLHMHLVDGDVTECLPPFSRAESFDIVVMGVLSRSLVQRILIGNTARRLLDELECDVLIVKPPGFQTPVTRPSARSSVAGQ
jgi:universal stress protein E